MAPDDDAPPAGEEPAAARAAAARRATTPAAGARRRIRRDDVIDAAIALADEDGLGAVTLAAVADLLGCRAPSLYTHVESLDDLLDEAACRVAAEFSDHLRDAVMARSGDDGVRAFAVAWRQWVAGHPGRYQLSLLRPADERRQARRDAGVGATNAAAAVLGSLGIAPDELADAGRALRATLHGFAHLESEGSIGPDPDRTFSVVVDTLVAGLHHRRAAADPGVDPAGASSRSDVPV